MHLPAVAREVSDPLKVELLAIISCLTWLILILGMLIRILESGNIHIIYNSSSSPPPPPRVPPPPPSASSFLVFSLFAFQMFSPFQVSPLETSYSIQPPTLSIRVLQHPPTNSCLPALAFTYTGASELPVPRAAPPTDVQQGHTLSLSHVPRATCPSTCTFWLVVQSPGALRVLAS